MESDASLPAPVSRWPVLLVGAAVVWCVYVRAVGLFTDFWFDEVWSWSRALQLQSPWDVFTKLHQDNNHYLNTLWIYLLGDRAEWPLYRLPSVVTGIGTVLVLARIGFRWGRVEGLTIGLLGATSYMFLLYSTEARGYGPALFFATVCVDLYDGAGPEPSVARRVLFNASAVLGLLSHMSFLFPYAGVIAWSAAAEWRRSGSVGVTARRFAEWNAAPVSVFAVLYAVDLRHLTYLGGTALPPWDMAVETLCFSLGLPHVRWARIIAVAFVASAFVVTFVRLGREGNERRWLYVIGAAVAPAVVIAITRPTFFFPRYFLACVPPLILMLGDYFATLWRTPGRMAVPLLLAGMCVGNVLVSVEFLRDGRGHYLDAFTEMARSTQGRDVTMGTNWDLHVRMMSEYYVHQVASDKSFDLVPSDRDPEWLVWEYYDNATPEPSMRTDKGTRYQLRKDYPFSARLSGAGWWLYQRVPAG